MIEENDYRTDHLRHEPTFCLAPGLFRSLPKRNAAKGPLEVDYETGDLRFEFRAPYYLVPVDLRVLQGIVAMSALSNSAGDGPANILASTSSDLGLMHRQSLQLNGPAMAEKVVLAKTTFYELAKEIGYNETSFHSGPQVHVLRRSIERLWMTSLVVEDKSTNVRSGSQVLSRYQSGKGGFSVAVNFHIAAIILGVTKKYTRISMAEIRALKTDPARLIHQRLCAWIDPGKSGHVEMETLCGYVWPEVATNVEAMRRRKMYVRKALGELEALGWGVSEYVSGKYRITRRGEPN